MQGSGGTDLDRTFDTAIGSNSGSNMGGGSASGENEGPKTVQEVLSKAADIPQILNETMNLLPGKDILKYESSRIYNEDGQEEKRA